MGMHSFPASGLVIEVTPENIRKLDLGQIGEDFIKSMENKGLDDLFSDIQDSGDYEEFFGAFYDKYKISMEIIQIQEEADGCEGVEPCGFYFDFNDEDKYIKTVRQEWKNLPIEPQEASWCDWG